MDATRLEPDPGRAEQLLRAMHKVLSHDLPNHLVVLQSLIQLLDLEERAHLGAQGQEYLTRLTGAAQRTQRLCKFLKDMERLHGRTDMAETIGLTHLLDEIRAEQAQATPPCTLTWKHALPTVQVRVGRRGFHRCLAELVGLAADLWRTPGLEGQVAAAPQEGRVGLRIRFAPAGTSILPPPGPPGPDKIILDQRLDFLLARELAAAWQGDLQATLAPGVLSLSLTVPTPHV